MDVRRLRVSRVHVELAVKPCSFSGYESIGVCKQILIILAGPTSIARVRGHDNDFPLRLPLSSLVHSCRWLYFAKTCDCWSCCGDRECHPISCVDHSLVWLLLGNSAGESSQEIRSLLLLLPDVCLPVPIGPKQVVRWHHHVAEVCERESGGLEVGGRTERWM